jgi:molybdopterin-binding protein
MWLSARNQLKGKIVGVTKGPRISASTSAAGSLPPRRLPNEAVDDLAFKVGDDAFAVIKASDVMVAK